MLYCARSWTRLMAWLLRHEGKILEDDGHAGIVLTFMMVILHVALEALSEVVYM